MTDADNKLSIAAIIISLIAMAVAFGQVSAQWFGTAEGYRRCREEVIGQWALRTYRKWHWYEFRFETRFTVPHIDLKTFAQLADTELQRRDRMQHLSCQDCAQLTPEIKHTIHLGLNLDDSKLLASWIPLISALHGMFNGYRLECYDCKSSHSDPSPMPWVGELWLNRRMASWRQEPALEGMTVEKEGALLAVRPKEGVGVAIRYREMSRDFMPTEAIRPMASSHLGSLIVLATRLGMRCNLSELKAGKLCAEGNGYSISPVEIRGLGMAITFNDESLGKARRDFAQIIPSEPANKMLCGILPGDPELLEWDGKTIDFPIIGDDGQLSLNLMHNALHRIGFDARSNFEEELKQDDMHLKKACFNDIVRLIPPFLPLYNSGTDPCICVVQYSGFLSEKPASVFDFWESRKVFVDKIVEMRNTGILMPAMQYVHDSLIYLESEFHADFYFDWWGAAINKWSTARRKMRLIETYRDMHSQTTAFFRTGELRLQGSPQRVTSYPPLHFTDVLGAYSMHAFKASIWASGHWDDCKRMSQDPNSELEDRKDDTDPLEVRRARRLRDYTAEAVHKAEESYECASRSSQVQEWSEIGHAYVEQLHRWFMPELRSRAGLRGNWRHHRNYMSDADLEELYWMLLLRGLAWEMSLRIEMFETAIPASMYGNRTPVWIL